MLSSEYWLSVKNIFFDRFCFGGDSRLDCLRVDPQICRFLKRGDRNRRFRCSRHELIPRLHRVSSWFVTNHTATTPLARILKSLLAAPLYLGLWRLLARSLYPMVLQHLGTYNFWLCGIFLDLTIRIDRARSRDFKSI